MNCSNLISGFNQFINLTKPFKLKSLIINKLYHIDKSLQLLLQKSGDYLENFRVGIWYRPLKQQLLRLLIKYCKNIKFLDLHGFEFQALYLIKITKILIIFQSVRHMVFQSFYKFTL
ncbi:hypothetical protein RhiirC2_802647 [Rhizophagus irregularis]|uniref:Uncharacterized protein n=1 Tax=Rhizophagus irregularis TaxID=588596 RepID=A0A2N1M153_9GLOM|nr:hypothetical protein RhiirC2_802647 [Rhizophagus irregularis]